jgi:hypothetical protein
VSGPKSGRPPGVETGTSSRLTTLTVAYVFSFVDRQTLNLLVGPIRKDLGISDTQMRLLAEFAGRVPGGDREWLGVGEKWGGERKEVA